MPTIKEIYESRLEDYKYRVGGEQLDAPCPFHLSKTGAPFTVNVSNGLFKCHNPSCEANEGGNVQSFLNLLGEEIPDTIHKVDKTKLSDSEVNRKHATLLKTESMLKYLSIHCTITNKTIEHFKLGWDGIRIWIPIYVDGKLVNIRKYNPVTEVKTLGVTGVNKPTLFPYENVFQDEIYFCSGEKDTILACQLGLNALTVTGAEGTFPKESLGRFNNKTVYIIHDIDTAGEKATNRIFLMLRKVAKKIVKVTLPVTAPNKDLTEFIVNEGKTIKDVKKAIKAGKVLHDKTDITTEIPVEVPLNELKNPAFFEHAIKTTVLVTGRDIDPYIVPARVKLQCTNPGSTKNCRSCPILGEPINIDFNNKELIKFAGISDRQLQLNLLEAALMPRCSNVDIDKQKLVSMFRVQLQTPISIAHSREDKPTTAQGFILQHDAEANKMYECTGIVTSDPTSQYATLVIHEISQTNSEIDNFVLEEKWRKKLTIFQP